MGITFRNERVDRVNFEAREVGYSYEAESREFGIVGGAGSDGHVPDALGAAYVEMDDFDTPMEFLAALASADVIGHHWDEPRPWTPRIVPSVARSQADGVDQGR